MERLQTNKANELQTSKITERKIRIAPEDPAPEVRAEDIEEAANLLSLTSQTPDDFFRLITQRPDIRAILEALAQ